MNSKLKRITGDFALNLLASVIVTAVTQLFLYPLINAKVGNIAYGDFLTVIGIVNTVAAVIGTTLNNVRLISEEEYSRDGLSGDFNAILLIAIFFILIILTPIWNIFFQMNEIETVFISILTMLMSIRNYWIVEYRIIINYKKVLKSNVCLVIGYLLGSIGLIVLKCWLIPMVAGEVFCFLYLMYSTKLYKEPYKLTSKFKNTLKDIAFVGITTLSANLLVYLDRLLLHPILGAETVTIYTVASIGGKYLGIVASPMSGVLLSYYSQKGFVMSKKKFWLSSIGIIFLALFSLFVINPISPVLIRILYPNVYTEVLEIILPANIAGVLVVVSNFIQPAILRFAPSKWQIVKEIVYGGIYICLGFILLESYGLIGFCYANIIAILCKIIVMLLIGNHYCKAELRNGEV